MKFWIKLKWKQTFPEYFKNENEKNNKYVRNCKSLQLLFHQYWNKPDQKNPEKCHFTDYMKEKFNVDNESIIKIIDTLTFKTSYEFDGISTK